MVILFRDMMTYGFLEKYYLEARRAGVRFIRYEKERPPVLAKSNGKLTLTCYDPSDHGRADLRYGPAGPERRDRSLAERGAGQPPQSPEDPGGLFPGGAHEAAARSISRPTASTCAASPIRPRTYGRPSRQAEAAVAKACTLLSKEQILVGGVVAEVQGDKCAACLTCVRACPYGVPVINAKGEAEIDISKCKGCGTARPNAQPRR